jgi:hypothetical protein
VTANNVSQIVRPANTGRHACREDVAHADKQFTEIRDDFGKTLSLISEIADRKSGKSFMRAIRTSDLTEQITETTHIAEAEQSRRARFPMQRRCKIIFSPQVRDGDRCSRPQRRLKKSAAMPPILAGIGG